MRARLQGDITPDFLENSLVFRAYGDDFIKINQQRYEYGILVHKGAVTGPWGPEQIRNLRVSDLKAVFQSPPDILLLGSGRKTTFPAAEVLTALSKAHIPFECMDSRSAARTYNILLGEGRDVSAAMLLPSAG